MRCKRDGTFGEANRSKCKPGCRTKDFGGLKALVGEPARYPCKDIEDEDFDGGVVLMMCKETQRFGKVEMGGCYKNCANPEPFEGFTKGGMYATYPCKDIPLNWGIPEAGYMSGMAKTMCEKNGEWAEENDFSQCVVNNGCMEAPEGAKEEEKIDCAKVKGCL